jgi:hypothetical protein
MMFSISDNPFASSTPKSKSKDKKSKNRKGSSVLDFGFSVLAPVESGGMYGDKSVISQDRGSSEYGNFSSNVSDYKKSSSKASGLDTISQMAPQYKKYNYQGINYDLPTRGPNYSDPKGVGYNAPSVVTSSKARGLSKSQVSAFAKAGGYTVAKQAELAKIPTMSHLATSKQQTYQGVKVSNAGSAARITKINRARVSAHTADKRSDPALGLANSIMAQLGTNFRYSYGTRRRRRGRYVSVWQKIYVGPSTRKTYYRTIHNGRRVRAYRGWSTGQVISAEAPHGVVNDYYQRTGVVNYVKENKDKFEIPQINTISGLKGTYAYYDRIMSVAKSRKSEYEKYAEPLAAQELAYIQVTPSQLSEVKEYHSDLTDASLKLDEGVTLAKQGIVKQSILGGSVDTEYGGKRALLNALGQRDAVFGQLTSRLNPVKSKIDSTVSNINVLDAQITASKADFNQRETLHRSLTSFGVVKPGEITQVSDAKASLEAKIPDAEARLDAANRQMVAAQNIQYRGGRSAMRQRERARSAARNAVSSAKSNLSKLKSTISELESSGGHLFEDGIGKSFIAEVPNTRITATGRKGAYSQKHGSVTIKIPKRKVPESGKVMVEATVSYSGYKGSVVARTNLGNIQGALRGRSTQVKTEVPVNPDGTITIKTVGAGATGNKYNATIGLSNIKVYDPRTIDVYNKIESLTSQKAEQTQILADARQREQNLESADIFLRGGSSAFNVNGKSVASFTKSGELNIKDQDVFKSYFGNVDDVAFKAAKHIQPTISKIDTKYRSVTNAPPGTHYSEEQQKSRALQASNLEKTKSFVQGKTYKLTLERPDGTSILAATRGQGGFVDIKDKQSVTALGVPLQDLRPETVTANKIGGLETSVTAKEAEYNKLMTQLGERRAAQVEKNTKAKVSNLVELEKKHLITRRDRTKQVAELMKEKALALKQVEDKEYFPDIETFDNKTDDDRIDTEHEATKKILKRGQQAKALANVTRSRTKFQQRIRKPRESVRPVYRAGPGQKLPFFA